MIVNNAFIDDEFLIIKLKISYFLNFIFDSLEN